MAATSPTDKESLAGCRDQPYPQRSGPEVIMVHTVASTCWECASKCGSLITVGDDGRVAKIMPNTKSPVSKGAFCVKGMRALPEWTYPPDRLTHPMRRVGERGSGRWERVSLAQGLG